ncbi:hypothetical protein U27_03871 [Candidatus Vecturithrix granuli]|uniref:DUF1850 domain-containing protein n=1 Tax=Vecturithrix granuli TaxID=1499967 RepID=A0A081BX52_VECG1|nr:hypothetical protein U27_03871 [Candidatus Vecturithrix granuli]
MLSTLIPALLFWFVLPIHTLTVTDLSTGDVIIRCPIAPGDTFKSVYIHSLELTPVWEYFQIDARYDIILTDTLYESTGAGLPIPIDGQDTFRKEGRQFHIFNIQRRLPAIVLRVNSAYDNCIMLNDTLSFNLSDTLGNAVVRIETNAEPLGVFTFRTLYRDLVHHFGDHRLKRWLPG